MYHEHEKDFKNFWAQKASALPWFRKWDDICVGQSDQARWFVGGLINASYAAVDVHVHAGKGDLVALRWVCEDGREENVTYDQLYQRVNAAAWAFGNLGIKRGDCVVLYMPMIVETVVAMLALARLGAMHNLVFAGFSAQALADRINDCRAEVVITADITMRRGKQIKLKDAVDSALGQCPAIKKVIVVDRGCNVVMDANHDVFWHELMPSYPVYVQPEPMDAAEPLFTLYTSGTTGKPKGIVHSTGGYLTHVYWSLRWAFDPQPNAVYWCTADVGWITGHSYVVYGPLMHGLQVVLYEGAPDYPTVQIWWQLIDRHKVSVFYTAPTALRLFMQHGKEIFDGVDLTSLTVLGSVGEPITSVVWQWYFKNVGQERCPIIDTWWQTETGGFMISPQARFGLEGLVPGSATKPLPGIFPQVVDEHGKIQEPGKKGFLIIEHPWPGMMMGILYDSVKTCETYWSKFPGKYYAGDFAVRDEDGNFWLLGRADEVLNIAGHRIGTAEIENAVLACSHVTDAAVVGVSDQVRGEVAAVFAVLNVGYADNQDRAREEIIAIIRKQLGAFVIIKRVVFVTKVPKTRSGKIMRRLLAAVAQEKSLGDMSTVEDGVSTQEIRDAYQQLTQSI